MTKRLTLAAVLTLLAAAPLRADFNSLVRAVETIPGMRRVPIPAFGLVRFAVWMIHPKGVHDIQLATFETRDRDGERNEIDQAQLEKLIRRHADAGYQPLVQVRSRRAGEVTLIWARPARGDRVELLLLAHERGDETVVLRTVVDIETVAREIGNPHTAVRIAKR
jgi:hypothetical protein